MKFYRSLILVLIFVSSLHGFTQPLGLGYVVKLKDKSNSPFSINRPTEFLTSAAIQRRSKQGIPIDLTDLPVNSSYISAIVQTGARVASVSRWFNWVAVWVNTQAEADEIKKLEFVASVSPMSRKLKSSIIEEAYSKQLAEPQELITNTNVLTSVSPQNLDYGRAKNQVGMINGHFLHDKLYRGIGITIAVLDAGFRAVNSLDAFANLYSQKRLLGTVDFVRKGNDVYNSTISGHGSNVLSAMASWLPGQIIGTAPEASYWLIRTEDAVAEYMMEEFYWISGAEFADSIGAHVINSSLGYTTFDDAAQNHTYADMNGITTPVSMGADMAVAKGMVVVTSAGNDGNSAWRYICAPADGRKVLAVGAVDAQGVYASFSSRGPTPDGRIKPDISAQGQATAVVTTAGNVALGNGTSFSSPVVAGMVACLWQAVPDATASMIIGTLRKSASQFNTPDDKLGYGIPDFRYAYYDLTLSFLLNKLPKKSLSVVPNPISEKALAVNPAKEAIVAISVYDLLGRRWIHQSYQSTSYAVELEGVGGLPLGTYLIIAQTISTTLTAKVVKL